MTVASYIIDRADRLMQNRMWWVSTWMDIARLVIPTESAALSFSMLGGAVNSTGGHTAALGLNTGPNSVSRVKSIYDNTGMLSVDRLAAGMESLVTPQSEKWHGLTVADIEHGDITTEEAIYLERLRNFQFSLRYDPKAGFIPSHQKAMRSCIAFGTGITFVEGADRMKRPGDPDLPLRYQFVPLAQAMLDCNDYGTVDTCYRCYTYTVKQMVQKFGYDNVSAQVQALYDKGIELDRYIDVIHAVCPRQETGSSLLAGTLKGSPIASYFVERDTKWLVKNSGFFEFPFNIYHWLQSENSPYAESPVMLALSEIKSLQQMGKAELRAFQQWTDPPLGLVNDGVMNRPNLNPRALNYGAVGPNGELRIKPIITAQSPNFAEQVMDVRRNMVKDTLYINLFQILIKNPEMTATEAMLRANEKGELLGPAGGKIQMALANMVDRELSLLERAGIFKPASAFAPPASVAGKSIGVRFTSPLDRMRRANEGQGTMQLLQAVEPLAKVKPRVLDLIDEDQTIRNLREIFGAPADTLVSETVLKQRRDQSDKDAATAKNMMAGQSAADIAKSGSVAAGNFADAAVQSPQIMQALSEILDRLKSGVQANPSAPTEQVDGANALLSQFGKGPVLPPVGQPGLG